MRDISASHAFYQNVVGLRLQAPVSHQLTAQNNDDSIKLSIIPDLDVIFVQAKQMDVSKDLFDVGEVGSHVKCELIFLHIQVRVAIT